MWNPHMRNPHPICEIHIPYVKSTSHMWNPHPHRPCQNPHTPCEIHIPYANCKIHIRYAEKKRTLSNFFFHSGMRTNCCACGTVSPMVQIGGAETDCNRWKKIIWHYEVSLCGGQLFVACSVLGVCTRLDSRYYFYLITFQNKGTNFLDIHYVAPCVLL